MTAVIEKFCIFIGFPIQDLGLVLIASLVFIYGCRIFFWVNPRFNRIYISIGLTLLSIFLRLSFLYIYNNSLFFVVCWVYCICLLLLGLMLIFIKFVPSSIKQSFSSNKIKVLASYLDAYLIVFQTAAELHVDAYKVNLVSRKDSLARFSSILWPYSYIVVLLLYNIDSILDSYYLSLGVTLSERPLPYLFIFCGCLSIILALDLLFNYLKLSRGFATVEENWDLKLREVLDRYAPYTGGTPDETGGLGIPKVGTVRAIAEQFSDNPSVRRNIVRGFYFVLAMGVCSVVAGASYKTYKLPEVHASDVAVKEATIRAQEATVRAQEATARAQEALAEESRVRKEYMERKILESFKK